jgi:hypothetical protein
MTSPVEHPGSPSSITAGLLASGFAQMPFVLSRSERNDLQSLSIDRWTRRSGPGASYLPDGEEPDHAFESLSRRLLGLVRVTALELAELGALPKGIAVGGACTPRPVPTPRRPACGSTRTTTWRSSLQSSRSVMASRSPARPRLRPAAGRVASAAVTRRSGGDARCRQPCPALESGAIPACRHRVNGGPARRSFLLFFVGDEERCHSHGRRDCRCGAVAGILRIYHWLHWAAAARQVLDRDEASSPS